MNAFKSGLKDTGLVLLGYAVIMLMGLGLNLIAGLDLMMAIILMNVMQLGLVLLTWYALGRLVMAVIKKVMGK